MKHPPPLAIKHTKSPEMMVRASRSAPSSARRPSVRPSVHHPFKPHPPPSPGAVLPALALCDALLRPAAAGLYALGARVDGAQVIGALVAIWPLLLAVALTAAADVTAAWRSPRKAFAAPFHRERVAGVLGLHLLAGAACTVVPAFDAVHTALAPRGEAAFCRLPWHSC